MPFVQLPTRRSFLHTVGFAAGAQFLRAENAGNSIHWALLSDTHISLNKSDEYRNFRPYENLLKVLPQVKKTSPEVVLINGDLARLEGLPGDYDLLRETLQPVSESIPLCLGLGNHDHRKNFRAVFQQPMKGQAQPLPDKYVVVVEQGPLRIISLDSLLVSNQTPGLLGKAQRTWLDDFLRSAGPKPAILFVHHPLDDRDNSLLDSDRLMRIVTPHKNVKAILYGHTHAYHYDVVKGIHLINLPAVGYNFTDPEPVGWVDAHLTKEGGEFTLHAIGGNTAEDGKTRSVKWRS